MVNLADYYDFYYIMHIRHLRNAERYRSKAYPTLSLLNLAMKEAKIKYKGKMSVTYLRCDVRLIDKEPTIDSLNKIFQNDGVLYDPRRM